MMKKEKTFSRQYHRTCVLLAMSMLATMTFAHPRISIEQEKADCHVLATDTLEREMVYRDVIDQMPQFPGGFPALARWLGENMTYPPTCYSEGIEGRVVVEFIVDKSGAVRDAKVLKSVHPELDAEALRLVMAMPRWNPGQHKGQAVNVRYSIPLSFKLPESDEAETSE